MFRSLALVAEREGFEPPEPCSSTVFKTAAIDHSAIFPRAKITPISDSTKCSGSYCMDKHAIRNPSSKIPEYHVPHLPRIKKKLAANRFKFSNRYPEVTI